MAEDLGIITPEVKRVRDKFCLPGMKILQFAFDGNSSNPYLPENIKGDKWVVYTGTHDNPTTLGWWNSLDIETKERINNISNNSIVDPVWRLLEIGLKTEANLVVAPLQDLLSLGDEARFNTPGTIGNNWCWRLTDSATYLKRALKAYADLGRYFNRCS